MRKPKSIQRPAQRQANQCDLVADVGRPTTSHFFGWRGLASRREVGGYPTGMHWVSCSLLDATVWHE